VSVVALPTRVLAASSSESSENFVDFHTPLWQWAALLAFITVLLMVDCSSSTARLTRHRRRAAPGAVTASAWCGLIFPARTARPRRAAHAGFLIERACPSTTSSYGR
jgi:hypothetical protein